MSVHYPVTYPVTSAVLIPSRGRPRTLAQMFQKMPFLLNERTFIGIQYDEYKLYKEVCGQFLRAVRVIKFNNPDGSVGVAREALRQNAVIENYQWYVATDDNARYTETALNALVQSAQTWQNHSNELTFMAGLHSTATHFDRNNILKKEVVNGWTTYPGIGFIFHAVPHEWYANYSYPGGCFALEDRHMMLSAINAGHREFRVCMEAPFSKKRYEPGGQGDLNKRRWNCGRSIEQIAHDFPMDVGITGTMPLRWKEIIAFQDGATGDRLVGGAMRKGEAILRHDVKKGGKLTIRRVRKVQSQ